LDYRAICLFSLSFCSSSDPRKLVVAGQITCHVVLWFAKSLCPTQKNLLISPQLFSSELQADSSTSKNARREHGLCLGWVTKALGQKMTLEPTLPPHNDGAARRVSERIESYFQPVSELM
jgi:hypothetical protein